MDCLKFFPASAILFLAFGAFAQGGGSRAEYITRYRDIAIEHAERYGIPASVKMAQGILESAYGTGTLARKGNSHFNIKVKASDNWRGEVVYHDDDRPNEAFRAYDTPEDSWIDHSEYLDRQPRYDSLFRYGVTDYRSWAYGLKNAGYATDQRYAEKLIRIIEENRLWELDGVAGGGLDERSLAAVGPDAANEMVDPDRFVVVVRRNKN
jgi:flagellum-specific peptidoglycan hydrolase FlgJ